jgi:hypothetical protein
VRAAPRSAPPAPVASVDLPCGRVYIPSAMRSSVSAVAAFAIVVVIGITVLAQTPADKQQLPKGQMPELGRPTKVGDELPLFDFDAYFPGTWTFEWDMPEGPLGPSGPVTGKTVYKVIDAGRVYEADTDATGPGGAFTLHEVIAYQQDNKALSRYVTDSRGFSYLQLATIGGDLGGIYNIFYDSTPFTYNGHTIRIKHGLRTMSPFNYKVATTVSVDGGPFRNYGNPWWRKDTTATK